MKSRESCASNGKEIKKEIKINQSQLSKSKKFVNQQVKSSGEIEINGGRWLGGWFTGRDMQEFVPSSDDYATALVLEMEICHFNDRNFVDKSNGIRFQAT